MELVVGENTYVTVVGADEFINAFYTEFEGIYIWWNGLTIEQQEKFLLRSARAIDRLPFTGYRTDGSQAMSFPRNDESDIPEELIEAQILNAHFIANHERDQIRGRGVKKYTIDNISEEFFSPTDYLDQVYSPDVIGILAYWLRGGYVIR